MAEISVVVPTYNRAALIGETLAAIFGQTRPPDEILVVDDGSTDDTQQVLTAYAGRLTAIRHANSGELVTRNLGLRAARGHLVAFCDSDDVWQPDHLASMARLWEAEPALHAAYADFQVLQDGRLAEATKFDEAPPDFWQGLRPLGPDAGVFDAPILQRMLRFQPFFPSTMMVDRAAFLALGGWDEAVSRQVGCDFATTLRVFNAPPVGVVRRPLVKIRKHAANFSGDAEKMNLGDARILEHVLRTRPELAPLRAPVEASIASRRVNAFHTAFGRMDFAACRAIAGLIPGPARTARLRAKLVVARLPPPLARLAAAALDPSRR